MVNLSHSARPVKECGKFLIVKSGILSFEFENKAQRIRNPIIDWIIKILQVPLRKTGIRNPKSKTCLGLVPYRI